MALPPRVFCDTSFFYACLDPADANHVRAGELVTEAADSSCDLWTTWDIVSETVALLRYHRGYSAALVFLNKVKPALRILLYGDRVRVTAEGVFRQFARYRPLSFCDAVSFVVVTTLLDDMPCFSFDRDFRRLGLTVLG